jgi:hypothetical protein
VTDLGRTSGNAFCENFPLQQLLPAFPIVDARIGRLGATMILATPHVSLQSAPPLLPLDATNPGWISPSGADAQRDDNSHQQLHGVTIP